MAAAIAKHHSTEVNIKSAGVFAEGGHPASGYSIEALREQGVSIEHSSQLLTHDLVEWATHIITMTSAHKEFAIQRFPEARTKIYTIKELSQEEPTDVIDPFGGTLDIYRQTFKEIEKSVHLLLKNLDNRVQ